MRDEKITIQEYNSVLITLSRTAPIETTIIATRIGNTIETIGNLKQIAADVLGVQANTLPVAAANYLY